MVFKPPYKVARVPPYKVALDVTGSPLSATGDSMTNDTFSAETANSGQQGAPRGIGPRAPWDGLEVLAPTRSQQKYSTELELEVLKVKRLIWPIIALAAVFLLGVVVALSVSDHAEQRAVIRAQATQSAATSITLFLLAVILSIVLLAGGVVIGWHWLRGYQEREKMRKAVQQAQVYALLNGARLPTGGHSARPSIPAPAGGNVLVFPGEQQAPVVSEPEPLPTWEVLQ